MYTLYPGLNPLLDLLKYTGNIRQLEKWHPEIYVLNHSLQVFKLAVKETDDIELILAALFHDIGKLINSLGHEDISADILKIHQMPNKVIWLVENHMRVWAYIKGEMKKQKKCKELSEYRWFPQLVQLARWDHIGRNPNANPTYSSYDIIGILIDKLGK